MLSPEHVRARRKKDALELMPLTPALRARAVSIAREALGVAGSHTGEPRETVERAWAAIETKPSERRLADGLVKLVDDLCEFKMPEGFDPALLRRDVFSRATAMRRELAPGERLDRVAVFAAAGAALGLDPNVVEQGLYEDLRSAQRLLGVATVSAEELVLRYDNAQLQAVLLRAVRVRADVHCATPDTYRALFHKLKFRQLLHRVTRLDEGGYRIEIDGPMSLFGATTKYGLELALVVPALLACDRVDLTAELRWGKRRDALTFQLRHGAPAVPTASPALPALRDEVQEILGSVNALSGVFRAELAGEILDMPGLGLCIPDLAFVHEPSGQRILCEVLGFWSRDAVFRRIELAKAGLAKKILFLASARLRVSEELFDGMEESALYVYKGKVNVRTLLRRLEALL
jgi:predicted nuclease of restriction endonuclease-like RecB superfamily